MARGMFSLLSLAVGMASVAFGSAPLAHAATAISYQRTIGSRGYASMYPSGLDVDSSGNIYVADTGAGQIASYAPSGALRWRVGSHGYKTLQNCGDPRDVAVLAGVVYVADTANGRVVERSAATGSPILKWPVKFGALMGISAGRDGSGNPVILVTDANRNAIQIFTPAGALIRTIGSGPGSGNGQLRAPRDAATDSHGNVYVADYMNDRIAKFGPLGAWLLNWGTTGSGAGAFHRPYGVDVSAGGIVYVADSNNNRVQRFTTSGGYIGAFGSTGTGPGQFSQLRRVAVGDGTSPLVYTADLWGYNVQRFTATGTFQLKIGGSPPPLGGFNEPSGLAVDTQVFVADAVNQRIQSFGLTGGFIRAWGHRGWGSDLLGFAWPRDVSADASTGKIWVADTKNSRIVEFTRSGVPTGRRAGTDGSSIGALHWPLGIATAGSAVVVADTGNNKVERWDNSGLTVQWTVSGLSTPSDVAISNGLVYVAESSGRRVTVLRLADGARVGSFGSTSLHYPAGIAVDPGSGAIWVADSSWNRLVQFSPAWVQLQTFGSFGTGAYQFNNPTKLEISGGNLYVADQWNDRVQVFHLG